MIWRPKEKELTPEEAVALARKELAPFWIGSEPLLAAVHSEQGVSLFPLDEKFANRARLLVFADLTDFSMLQLSHYMREWHNRYLSHGLQIVIVVQSKCTELRVPSLVAKQLKKLSLPAVAVIDQEGLFSEALGARNLPFLALLHQKRTVFTFDSRDWAEKTEIALQSHLRVSDPGLPLPLPYKPERKAARALGAVDFGRGGRAEFPEPGFQLGENGLGTAVFNESIVSAPPPGSARVFSISGAWVQDADRILTSDPKAGISFHSPGREFAVVARALGNSPARIVTETSGGSALEAYLGDDLVADDEGQSSAQIVGLGSYHLLTGLGPDARLITLRFPHASRAPIALYGLRFGD